MWEMPFAGRPVPEWLAELGEAVAGHRLDARQSAQTVPGDALLQLRERLAGTSGTNSYVMWVRWFLAQPGARPVSPSAILKNPDYGLTGSEERSMKLSAAP
jgi:hypothetical protein